MPQGKGTQDKPFKISPSQLGSFCDCACCYWLAHNAGMKKPTGIMAGLPIGIDTTFRTYYRRHADSGTVPTEISSDARFKGWTMSSDVDLVSKRIQLDPKDHIISKKGYHYTLFGTMDEMLVDDNGLNVIVDFKTKASKKSSDKGPHPSAIRIAVTFLIRVHAFSFCFFTVIPDVYAFSARTWDGGTKPRWS